MRCIDQYEPDWRSERQSTCRQRAPQRSRAGTRSAVAGAKTVPVEAEVVQAAAAETEAAEAVVAPAAAKVATVAVAAPAAVLAAAKAAKAHVAVAAEARSL